MSNKSSLVSLVEHEKLPELKKMDEFLQIVNSPPPKSWVKMHPTAKNVKYLPIENVEALLTMIFQEWRVEILREGQMLNSLFVTVRLQYKHPITKEWGYQDGTGAVGVQTDKDAKASDMTAIKSDGVMKALPAAESYAIKDAAEKLGKIFGKDLNRKDSVEFVPSYLGTEDTPTEKTLERFKAAKTPEDIETILGELNPADKKAFALVATNRLKEIRNANKV